MISSSILGKILTPLLFPLVIGGLRAEELRIKHDGMMRASAREMSFRGTGVSQIETAEFILSVRGQFRIVSSAKITLQPSGSVSKRPVASPVWVSLVAVGEIELTLLGETGAHLSHYKAKTAVYHVKENRWVLDSKEIESRSPQPEYPIIIETSNEITIPDKPQ